MLVSQKELCDEMISEKEKLIDKLQEDLKQKDDQYVKDLRKQVKTNFIKNKKNNNLFRFQRLLKDNIHLITIMFDYFS